MPMTQSAALVMRLGFPGRALAALTRRAGGLLLAAAIIGVIAAPARAAQVQQIKTPAGISAWLIESHTLPMLQMSLFFKGGASQDPADKPGLAYFADWMLDEGAGEMNTAAFYREKKLLGLSLSKTLTDERETLSFAMLSDKRDASVELLRKLLVEPRFDEDAMERARNEIVSSIEALRRNPADNIMQKLSEVLYPGHPYGAQRRGTPEAVKSITRQDLQTYRRKTFARDNLVIAVVGDIDAATLGVELDKIFGGLPAHAELKPMPPTHSTPPQDVRIADQARQTNIAFGYVLDTPLTADDMPAVQILDHILSGGILTSRLDREIRVKRGLVYSIGFSAGRTPYSQFAYGEFGAEPSNAEEAYALAREQIRKLAEEGPTPQEVQNAKTYLQGSYVVGLSNSASVAAELLDLQRFGYAPDAIDSYSARVEAVTMDQLRKLAKQIFKPDALTRVTVGAPPASGAVPAKETAGK
jgi:zinc protease